MRNAYPEGEPILVKIPNTDEYINMQPFFSIFKNVFENDAKQAADSLHDAIRYIGTHVTEDFFAKELSDNISYLYDVYDMFNNMEIKTEKI